MQASQDFQEEGVGEMIHWRVLFGQGDFEDVLCVINNMGCSVILDVWSEFRGLI